MLVAASLSLEARAQEAPPPIAPNGAISCAVNSVNAWVHLGYQDTDPATAPTFTAVAMPAHGSLAYMDPKSYGNDRGSWEPLAAGTPVESQSWGYTPSPGYMGADSFTYRVDDNGQSSNVATVSITVTGNTPPQANDQDVSVAQGAGRVVISLSMTDPDGQQVFSCTQLSPPAHGTLEWGEWVISGSGGIDVQGETLWHPVEPGVAHPSRLWGFTPAEGYLGDDSFTWKVSDGVAESGAATVSITITGNTAPVLQDQTVALARGWCGATWA